MSFNIDQSMLNQNGYNVSVDSNSTYTQLDFNPKFIWSTWIINFPRSRTHLQSLNLFLGLAVVTFSRRDVKVVFQRAERKKLKLIKLR